MLSISTIATGASQTAQYYTEKHGEVERYYESESQGVWVGGKGFGLDQTRVGSEFQHLLDGRAPDGRPLVTGSGEKRRVGYDLTFSADKSVSVLWARANTETRAKIENVFRESVENSLKFVESEVMTECVRRGKGGAIKESPKELVFATFQHGSSRAQDPQLHMHCVLLNMAERRDETFGAIDPKQVFKEQVLARKMFAAEFSTRLSRELGLEIKQTRDGFRVEGVPDGLIQHYSKRKLEIDKEAKALGVESAHGRERIALNTRDEKQNVGRKDLLQSWQVEMDRRGFTHEQSQKLCFGRKQKNAQSQDEVTKKTLADLSQHHSTFTESKLKQKLAENSQGLATIDELKRHFRKAVAEKEVVKLGRDGQGNMRFTTTSILEKEKELMSCAQVLSKRITHQVSKQNVDSVLQSDTYSKMSGEQRKAARHVFDSGDVAIIQGAAGSGKSFTMAAVRETYQAQNYNVIGLAPTGKAADELSRGAGIPSLTVDKYLYDRNKGQARLSKNDVVIVDEAGMLGSTKMSELLHDASQAGAKIILVGDHKQLQPIDFGNPFSKLKGTIGGAEINIVRRQEVEWQRSAAWDIREGRAFDALTRYESNNLLKLEKNAGDLRNAVARDYLNDMGLGGSQLILASTNSVAGEINKEIRENLKQDHGVLNKRRQFEVEARDREGNRNTREFCIGDRVYFTKNNRKIGVQNGSLGTVQHLKRVGGDTFAFEVKLDNGTEVKFTTDKYDRLDHGYAVTIHKSQGATVDRTYVVVSSNMDRESAYVAMTRHRQNANVYASKPDFEKMKLEGHSQGESEARQEQVVQSMATRLNRSQIKEMSIDFVKPEKVAQVIKQDFAELKPLEIHRELANKVNFASSRDEVSETLKQIAITPAGVDNEYKAYPMEHAQWQKQAIGALKSGDFSREKIQGIVDDIFKEQVGVNAVFTHDEKISLQTLNKDVGQVFERSVVMNREFGTEFVTKSQVQMANQLKQALPVEERANIVKQLYSEPSGVGKEFGFFNRSGTEVQNEARDILLSKDLSQERLNKLSNIVLSKTVGLEVSPQLLQNIVTERAASISKEFKVAVSYNHALASAEINQEFKTTSHDLLAEKLLATKSNDYSERAELIAGIAISPRGVGQEFGLPSLGKTETQKFAIGLLQKNDLSKSSVNKLCEMVAEMPMGMAPTDKNMLAQSEKLQNEIKPMVQSAATQAQQMDMKRSHERSRGHSMSR